MVVTSTSSPIETAENTLGMSLADYLARGDERFELINGREVPMSPHLMEHDDLSYHLHKSLLTFTLTHNLPLRIANETTFVDPANASSNWVAGSLMPDIMITREQRIADYKKAHPDWRKFPMALVPDLAIEVLSPNDRASDVLDKISDMLEFGVQTVWLINPRAQEITIYVDQTNPRTLIGDTLLTTDLLPGWSIAAKTLFADEFGA